MQSLGLQKRLFEMITANIPANISLVDALGNLLGISNDSAYRRLRGDTALTIEEVALICKQFNISFDSLSNIGTFQSVSFSYNPMKSDQRLHGLPKIASQRRKNQLPGQKTNK
ncbi:MAG: hypothetical protein HC896_02530 [Bacteroidales bacterium]|nr:hypothetical protein [Bacteroidales bacterium]